MAKNCFIYETLESVKNLKIKRNDEGLMTLSGVFGVCGIRNNNKRIYEAKNYGNMVNEMKQRIKKEGGIPGELEHPKTMNMTLENISHKITDINIDENGVVTGTIALLNTPKGKIAQAIVEGGLPLFISSRATGNVDKNGAVMLERIATYDLVGTPGFSQAQLHLNENQVVESLDDSVYVIYENNEENNNSKNMDLKELYEKLESLEKRIQDLESENEDLREQLEDIESASSKISEEQLRAIANGVEKWIIEEYTPKVEGWLLEHYSEEQKEDILSDIDEKLNEKAADMKNWIIEKYSPVVENWITNDFAQVVENWAKTELAEGVQKWIVEEYTPEVETWLNESYSPNIKQSITESINESKSKFSSVDELLEIFESANPTKPKYTGKSIVLENLDEPAYIREMPEDIRVKYNMAPTEVKESIARRAKLYNLTTEGAILRFWNNIDFNEIKPSKSVYEGLDGIENKQERAVRVQFRRFKKKF